MELGKRRETIIEPLRLSEKVARLRQRLHVLEWRRYGYLLLAGKYALHPSATPQGVSEFAQRAFGEEPAPIGVVASTHSH